MRGQQLPQAQVLEQALQFGAVASSLALVQQHQV